jgi:hypothetical protein
MNDGDDELMRQLRAELKAHGIDPNDPVKDRGKRAGSFVIVPRKWIEALQGASGRTYSVAVELLWKARFDTGSKPVVKLGNFNGVSRAQKARAVRELAERGLVEILPTTAHAAPTVRLRRGLSRK